MGKLKFKKGKKKLLILVILLIIVVTLGLVFGLKLLSKKPRSDNLKIELIGDKEISIKWHDGEYTDEGAKAYYKDEDISKDIKVTNNVDLEKVGTYSYKYTIKYDNEEKSIERVVKVIDEVEPVIKLKGDSSTFLVIGTDYRELGATASDNYDGDLTSKIEVDTSELNKDKLGEYKVHYKVKDSSGNETVVDRTFTVKPKASGNQKIAVLNYHFFYKDQAENKANCNQSICLQIDKFKEQLKYLNDNGYTTLTIDEFVAWMYGELEVPEKSVLITIDDGGWGTSKEKGNYLIPALEEYKVHATLFLIAGWWPKSNYESPYLDIESHTWNLHYEANCGHRSKVNCVSYEELKEDLHKSAVVIGSKQAFCFPFYDYTEQSVKAVKEEGFKVAFIGESRKASRNDDKWKIPRYPIYDSTSLETFKNMIS